MIFWTTPVIAEVLSNPRGRDQNQSQTYLRQAWLRHHIRDHTTGAASIIMASSARRVTRLPNKMRRPLRNSPGSPPKGKNDCRLRCRN
jgi:hypothetical protein